MPIRVDHDERRTHLAEAVWRIVLRDGLAAASVRQVAREAGLSMGSVRHFFGTQDELLLFAMTEVINRASTRIAATAGDREAEVGAGDPIGAATSLLEQTVPLDDERLVEARIWAAFASAGSVNPDMAAIRQAADDGIRLLCRNVVAALSELGVVHPSRDPDLETEHLWAVVDGITMHRLADPDLTTVARAKAILRQHLLNLALPPVVTHE